MQEATPTAASTSSYPNVPVPDPTQAGTLQTAAWNKVAGLGGAVNVLEGVGAAVRVTLPSGTNPTVTRVSPQAYKVTIHVSDTLQLTPGMADAQQNATSAVSPNSFNGWVYTSRNSQVVTVNSSGLVSGVSQGEATVL